MPPAPRIWKVDPTQSGESNAGGTFELKHIRITPLEFQLLYAWQFHRGGTLLARPVSSLAGGTAALPMQPISLGATVQVLETVGATTVGAIHVPLVNRTGQQLLLCLSSSAASTLHWSLAPVRQLAPLPHLDGFRYELSPPASLLPDIIWTGPATAYHVGHFAPQGTRTLTTSSEPVCVRFRDPAEIEVISLGQYLDWMRQRP